MAVRSAQSVSNKVNGASAHSDILLTFLTLGSSYEFHF